MMLFYIEKIALNDIFMNYDYSSSLSFLIENLVQHKDIPNLIPVDQ
jgi:hypothetical protein